MEKKHEITLEIEEELRIKQVAEFAHEIITRNKKFKKMWNTKVFSEEEKNKIREIGIKIEHELVNSIEELGFDDIEGDKSVLAAQLVSETMATGYFNAVNQLGMKTRIDM